MPEFLSADLALKSAPRAWQTGALLAWEAASGRGIVEVVTGAGKTVFALLCIQHLARTNRADRVVVVVPTTALLDQWYVALREEMSISEDAIGLWSGAGHPDTPKAINVMVVNTARRTLAMVCQDTRTFLIVDECHRVASTQNAAILAPTFSATLGMSATPERSYDDLLERVLVPALGDIVYRYTVDEALADGVLANYDLVNVRLAMLPREQQAYDNLSRKLARAHHSPHTSPETIEALLRKRARVSTRARMRVPAAVKIVNQNRGARAVVFHESVEDAEAIVAQLGQHGHGATIYHSRIAGPLRRDNLRLFRKGAFDVLVSCRALDEGVNIPEAQVAVIASASASSRQRVQRLGRVLRPSVGKTHATVYTLYATSVEERRLLEEAKALRSATSVSWRKVTQRDG